LVSCHDSSIVVGVAMILDRHVAYTVNPDSTGNLILVSTPNYLVAVTQ